MWLEVADDGTEPPSTPRPQRNVVAEVVVAEGAVGVEGSNLDEPCAFLGHGHAAAAGTAGMEPKLAITYSSQAPNGLLGVGFSISGLSAIGRSGPTQWHDGKRGGVSLTENTTTNESADRFTLDGQRLVIASAPRAIPAPPTARRLIPSPASPPSAIPMPARSHGR